MWYRHRTFCFSLSKTEIQRVFLAQGTLANAEQVFPPENEAAMELESASCLISTLWHTQNWEKPGPSLSTLFFPRGKWPGFLSQKLASHRMCTGPRKLLLYRASPCLKQTTAFLHAIQWFTSFLGTVAPREMSSPS